MRNSVTPTPHLDARTYPFLEAKFSSMRAPLRPVNIFELSGFPRWETVASRVLAYFLDSRDSRHGMGALGADALLRLLDGAWTISFDERPQVTFDSAALMGSLAWAVETEVTTDDGNRIDILMTNDELDLAIAVENKLDAAVNNPFSSYALRAAAAHSTVLTVVLAPTLRSLSGSPYSWVSAALTYDEFFESFTTALTQAKDPDRRSLELLSQFIENTSEKEQRVSANAEADMLEAFWGATAGKGSELGEFFKALTRVNAALRARAESLDALIRGELETRDLLKDSWLVAGYDRTWGRSDGRVAIVYVAYELNSGNCIELLLGQYPGKEWTGFAVKAYRSRNRASAMYSDFNHVPLKRCWRDPDADVAAEFVRRVESLELKHPQAV